MDDKSRMKVKMWLIVIGVAIIGYIFAVSIRMNMVKQPQGEYMRLQDGMILAEALKEETEENYGENKDVKGNEEYIEWKRLLKEDGERILTFGQFGRWLERELSFMEDVLEERQGQLETIKNLQKEYEKRYKPEFQFLQEDWYRMYEELLAIYGLGDSIRQTNVTVLGCGMEVTDGEGVTLGEDRLLAEEGEYFYQSDVFERNKYQAIRVYQKEETLLTVLETVGRGMDLENIWIMEIGRAHV